MAGTIDTYDRPPSNESELEWQDFLDICRQINMPVVENDDVAVARAKRFMRKLGPKWADRPPLGFQTGHALWLLGGVVYAEKFKGNKDA